MLDLSPPLPPRRKRPDAPKAPALDRFLVFRAGLAIVLLALAVPAFITSLALIPGTAARDDLNHGRPVSDDTLSFLYHDRLWVSSFHATNAVLNDLALVTTELARRKGYASAEGKKLIREALGWQTAALRASPADAFGWSRELFLTSLADGPSSAKLPLALAYSMEAAPFEPSLMLPRLGMAMYLYDRLDPYIKAQIPALMRTTWLVDPDATEAEAKAHNYSELLMTNLKDSPDTAVLLKKRYGSSK